MSADASKSEREHWTERTDFVMVSYSDEEDGRSHEDDLLGDFVQAVRDGDLIDPRAIADVIYDRLLTQERKR